MQHYKYASVTLILSYMPSQRKRIGFLPTAEVQKIIDKICSSEKISQSKVTGILVDEALKARLIKSDFSSNDLNNINATENEFNMVKEFIEYKRFKNMFKKAMVEND